MLMNIMKPKKWQSKNTKNNPEVLGFAIFLPNLVTKESDSLAVGCY